MVITSKSLPKLPLQKTKGLGRFCFNCGNGNPPSDWFFARNLGDGVECDAMCNTRPVRTVWPLSGPDG